MQSFVSTVFNLPYNAFTNYRNIIVIISNVNIVLFTSNKKYIDQLS